MQKTILTLMLSHCLLTATTAFTLPGAQITNDHVSLNFPISATFRASFRSDVDIQSILLEYGNEQTNCGDVIAKAFPTYGPYIASKAGVEGLVHVLANELRGRNITVNAVAPGPVATELFLSGKTEAQIEQLRKLPPLERLGEPDDIARVVSFLAGPDGAWVNAQVLRANGGFA